MTFCMIAQLWNTNTQAFVSCDTDLAENYMYISIKFMYFTGKLVYLIVLPSNQLAINSAGTYIIGILFHFSFQFIWRSFN